MKQVELSDNEYRLYADPHLLLEYGGKGRSLTKRLWDVERRTSLKKSLPLTPPTGRSPIGIGTPERPGGRCARVSTPALTLLLSHLLRSPLACARGSFWRGRSPIVLCTHVRALTLPHLALPHLALSHLSLSHRSLSHRSLTPLTLTPLTRTPLTLTPRTLTPLTLTPRTLTPRTLTPPTLTRVLLLALLVSHSHLSLSHLSPSSRCSCIHLHCSYASALHSPHLLFSRLLLLCLLATSSSFNITCGVIRS